MNRKLTLIGLLVTLVVSEPACKKHEQDPAGAIPAACQQDMETYQRDLGHDTVPEHINAFQTGSVDDLQSAQNFLTVWKRDNCEKSTALTGKSVARALLMQWYITMCKDVDLSEEDLNLLKEDAVRGRDEETRSAATDLWMIGKLCQRINQTNPSKGGTSL